MVRTECAYIFLLKIILAIFLIECLNFEKVTKLNK